MKRYALRSLLLGSVLLGCGRQPESKPEPLVMPETMVQPQTLGPKNIEAEYLRRVAALERIEHRDAWQQGQLEELQRPPIAWESTEVERFSRHDDFQRSFPVSGIVPEVRSVVGEWLLWDKSTTLDTLVTNITGAQYHVTARKHEQGVTVGVKFVGNSNW